MTNKVGFSKKYFFLSKVSYPLKTYLIKNINYSAIKRTVQMVPDLPWLNLGFLTLRWCKNDTHAIELYFEY